MALGRETFGDLGGAVSDLFSAEGYRTKAKGSRLSADNYDEAAAFADKNRQYTEISTGIKLMQADRQIYQGIGRETADIGGAGFAMSGSALDLLRSSTQQGALTRQTLEFQGEIAEAGYEQQAKSYRTMAEASRFEADAQDSAATGAMIGAGLKGAAALATLFTGGAAAPAMALVNTGFALPGQRE